MSFRQVMTHQPSRNYILGLFVSCLGDGVQFVANTWLALHISQSAFSVGLVLFCTALPGIFLSPFLGVLVDHYNRKHLAILMDGLRAAVVCAIPILYWTSELQVWHLCTVAFLLSLGDKVFQPAIRGLMREVVSIDRLLHTNSLASIAGQLGTALGAALSGVLIGLSSAPTTMLVNAGSFVVSALFLSLLRYHSTRSPKQKKPLTLWPDLKAGLQYLSRNTNLMGIYLISLFLLFCLYSINVLITPFVSRDLGLGAAAIGYIDGCFAVGVVLGGMVMPTLVARFGRTRVMSRGLFVMAAGLLLFHLSHSLGWAMFSYLVIGTSFSLYALFLTVAQEQVAPEFQGRVHSSFLTVSSVLSLSIYLTISRLLDSMSGRPIILVLSLLIAGSAVWSYHLLTRKLKVDTEPKLTEPEFEMDVEVLT